MTNGSDKDPPRLYAALLSYGGATLLAVLCLLALLFITVPSTDHLHDNAIGRRLVELDELETALLSFKPPRPHMSGGWETVIDYMKKVFGSQPCGKSCNETCRCGSGWSPRDYRHYGDTPCPFSVRTVEKDLEIILWKQQQIDFYRREGFSLYQFDANDTLAVEAFIRFIYALMDNSEKTRCRQGWTNCISFENSLGWDRKRFFTEEELASAARVKALKTQIFRIKTHETDLLAKRKQLEQTLNELKEVKEQQAKLKQEREELQTELKELTSN